MKKQFDIEGNLYKLVKGNEHVMLVKDARTGEVVGNPFRSVYQSLHRDWRSVPAEWWDKVPEGDDDEEARVISSFFK